MNFARNIQPLLQVELLTPAICANLIAVSKSVANGRQRKHSPSRVTEYAQAMTSGIWQLTPTHSIGIASDGLIVDGQHRIMAVIKANIPVLMWVARGVNPDIFSVIDRGLGRTDFQVASMLGLPLVQAEWAALKQSLLDPSNAIGCIAPITTPEDISAVHKYMKAEIKIAFPTFFGSSYFPAKGFRGAVIRAARKYPERKAEISEFLETSLTGTPTPSSRKAAILMNTYLLKKNQEEGRPNNLYVFTLKAIKAFLDYRSYGSVSVFKRMPDLKSSDFCLDIDSKPSYEPWAAFLARK